jgi:transposase-like protein
VAACKDGSGAIRNAYIHIFDNNKVVMCWAHMRRNVNKKLSIVKNKETTQEILDDIDQLQLCESEKVFRNASSLFLKKWISREEEFSTYFETEWLQNLNSWYEGYNIFTPSTNNALEATNRVIKDEHTFRERQPLSRFFTIANDIVHNWSKARNPNQSDPVVFSTEPTITLKKWTDAYHFAKSSKSVLEQP